jgi:lipoprotein NlpD
LNRFFVLLFLLAPLLMIGCASTQTAAPVRESSYPPKLFPPAPAGHYRIQQGDTLYKIAFENGLDYRDLAAWNKLSDASYIRSGDVLSLRPPKAVAASKVVTRPLPNKSVVAVSAMPLAAPLPGNKTDNKIDHKADNKADNKTDNKVEIVKTTVSIAPELDADITPDFWRWPSQGTVLARFGDGRNKGIDIAGARGSPILATAAGKVVYAGSGLRGYGKLIIIRHGKALLSAYAHAARILVVEGQNVASGQPIAEMGDTDTDRVKLHFEIREYGKPVDPLNYLPKQS